MGNNVSNPTERAPYEQLDEEKTIPGLKDQFRGTCWTLVLGPEGSGKSTIITQMRLAMEKAFSDSELQDLRQEVYRNLINVATAITELAKTQNLEFSDPANTSLAETLTKTTSGLAGGDIEALDPDLISTLNRLNKDPTTTTIVDRHRAFTEGYRLPPSTRYFLQNIDRIGGHEYVPTTMDILRVRQSGSLQSRDVNLKVHHGQVAIKELPGTMQLAKDFKEQRKTAAIFFCVPLDEYDSPTFRTILSDFKATVNSGWRDTTEVIVFLNRSDIFRRKLEMKPLSSCYSDYTGAADDPKACAMYLWNKFKRRNQSNLEIHCFVTNATSAIDTDYVVRLMKNQIVATWLQKTELRAK